jgi:hypothetical protein
MSSFSYVRSAIRISLFGAIILAVPATFGAGADRTKAQAQLLDRAAFLCDNCFFGASDYYYCFAVDNKVMVGYQRTPVLNWEDPSKNYLSKEHPSWEAWTAPSQTVPVSYDDKYIYITRETKARPGFTGHLKSFAFWATRADSKVVRLKPSDKRDIFMNSAQCRGTDKPKMH